MKKDIQKMIILAMNVAIFVLLSMPPGTISMGPLKITTQNIPLYLSATLYGKLGGAVVGICGMLLSQMITYGLTQTTIIWILPHAIVGILFGCVTNNKKFRLNDNVRYLLVVMIFQILLTILNTIAFYFDSKILGYYNFMVVFGSFVLRLMLSVISGIVYGFILPYLVKAIKKYINLTK